MARPSVAGLLIRLPASAAAGLTSASQPGLGLAGVGFTFEPLFQVAAPPGVGLAPGTPAQWLVARPKGNLHGAQGWQLAHEALASSLGLAAGAPIHVEPDLIQEWPYENPLASGAGLSLDAQACAFNDQDPKLPGVAGRFAWHLGDDFTELRKARALTAGAGSSVVRVIHLDTGFDPEHQTKPRFLETALQKNFVEGENADDARDPAKRGLLKNPGHGAGTLSILAGGRFRFSGGGEPFDEPMGGAPDARVVPVRVASSVVQFRTSEVAKALNYASELCGSETTRVHVLSMSMGGVASAAWADAVNKAYEAGVVLVTAAGNNFSAGLFGLPSHFIVYPARFRRVIAACGIMANARPYYGLSIGTMQGCWGPKSKMETALSAYTPNIAWAELGCAGIVDMDGSGTSAATPQVAAAAALYLMKHGRTLFDRNRYPKDWMRVEAVRHALFTRADSSSDGGSAEKLGRGIVKAARALAVTPLAANALKQTEADRANLAFLRVLTGVGLAPDPKIDMFSLEAAQLAHSWPGPDANPLESVVADPDAPAESVPDSQRARFLDALIEHPDCSPSLAGFLKDARSSISRRATTPAGGGMPSRGAPDASKEADLVSTVGGAPADTGFVAPEPIHRSLRGYSIDPSLSSSLRTAPLGEVTFRVPWEPLAPGPVGEYLEVVDVDPPSGCYYEPVNLDDPKLLGQEGLPPSEGTPQFHQQMVYAVSSLTISHFERALGRRVIWRGGASGPARDPEDDALFVQRLRVYPHALRERNAYYSPQKVALLFGYFSGQVEGLEGGRSRSMVFTCLSHDIVAHETAHAILDGMHRRLLSASNPDVLAFHEAFADIVALFQHFTLPDILEAQIAQTRGEIRAHENLLGQLASQFGKASGLRSALRDAIGEVNEDGIWRPAKPKPSDYETVTEPHARGAILVAAVFDAFLSIYERRTNDLLRIATRGSGILEPGAIHPDLVTRLAKEAASAARSVLTMCIRALDYCPPVDLTFGEFLRAILTADADLIRDDHLHYRVAFLEAFRRRGIQPQDVRTVSIESMLWRPPEAENPRASVALQDGLGRMKRYAKDFLFAESLEGAGASRQELFTLQQQIRRELRAWLSGHFQRAPEGHRDARYLGLDPQLPFEVPTARFAFRSTPNGEIVPQALLTVSQTRQEPVDPTHPEGDAFGFEGGSSIVIDLRRRKIRCCVRKNIRSAGRLARQREFAQKGLTGLRATYLGARAVFGTAEPFALLHRGS